MATVFREPNQVKWIGVRPGHNGEQVFISLDSIVTGVLYTVPADKILFLFDWHFGMASNVAAACLFQVRDDGGVVQANLAYVTSHTTATSANASNALWVPIEMPEAWDIYYTAAARVRGYFHGILIDA